MLKNIPKLLRQQRILKEYSQEYMAAQLGVSQQAYNKMENGATKIELSRLTKIAEILEINLVHFIAPVENSKPANSSKDEVNQPLQLIQHLTAEVNYLRKQNNQLLDVFKKLKK